ncbi:MAG TPA: hypothetical protein VF881_13105 [Polyangiaceae bacterium]
MRRPVEWTIRRLVADIDAMSRWGQSDDSDEDPWVNLQQAVYDFGDVREAAYAVVPHLVDAARTRRPEEQVIALEFVLDIALGKLEGSCTIPVDVDVVAWVKEHDPKVSISIGDYFRSDALGMGGGPRSDTSQNTPESLLFYRPGYHEDYNRWMDEKEARGAAAGKG